MTVIMKRGPGGFEGGYAFLECNAWERNREPMAMRPVLLKAKHRRKEVVKVAHFDNLWSIHGVEPEEQEWYHPIGWAEIPDWCKMYGFDEVME